MDDKQKNYAGNAKNTCDKCGKPVDGYFEYGKVEKPGEYIVKDKENHCADHGIQQQLKKEFKAKEHAKLTAVDYHIFSTMNTEPPKDAADKLAMYWTAQGVER